MDQKTDFLDQYFPYIERELERYEQNGQWMQPTYNGEIIVPRWEAHSAPVFAGVEFHPGKEMPETNGQYRISIVCPPEHREELSMRLEEAKSRIFADWAPEQLTSFYVEVVCSDPVPV